MEQAYKLIQLDLKRFGATSLETMRHTQTPEAPWIDETQLPARSHPHNSLGVFRHFAIGLTNSQAPRHSQVNDPLRGWFLCGASSLASRLLAWLRTAASVKPLRGRWRPRHMFQFQIK